MGILSGERERELVSTARTETVQRTDLQNDMQSLPYGMPLPSYRAPLKLV